MVDGIDSINESVTSYEAFVGLENKTDSILEYIDGIVYMPPSPSLRHQEISASLQGELYAYLKGKKCKVYATPTDVVLQKDGHDHKNKVVPDLFVTCNPDGRRKNEYKGSPDFIIEILSPSNDSHDSVTKLNLYMNYGVKEYWIVNPWLHNIMIYTLDEKNEYKLNIITEVGSVKSTVLTSFEINAEELFAD